jgi:hypothetical protein
LFEFKQKRTHFKIEQIFVVFSTKICVANKIFQRILKKNLFATQNFVEKTTKICSILKCVRFCLNSNKIYTFIFYSVLLLEMIFLFHFWSFLLITNPIVLKFFNSFMDCYHDFKRKLKGKTSWIDLRNPCTNFKWLSITVFWVHLIYNPHLKFIITQNRSRLLDYTRLYLKNFCEVLFFS